MRGDHLAETRRGPSRETETRALAGERNALYAGTGVRLGLRTPGVTQRFTTVAHQLGASSLQKQVSFFRLVTTTESA